MGTRDVIPGSSRDLRVPNARVPQGFKRRKVDLNQSTYAAPVDDLLLQSTEQRSQSDIEIDDARVRDTEDEDCCDNQTQASNTGSEDDQDSSSGYSSSDSLSDGRTARRSEIYLSPHALAQVERMKRDDSFPDTLRAENDQRQLFERAISLSPVKPRMFEYASWTNQEPDGDFPTSRWLFGTPSGESSDVDREFGLHLIHCSLDRTEDILVPTITKEEENVLNLEPPPYRSPSRISSMPPSYKPTTPSKPTKQPDMNSPVSLSSTSEKRVHTADKFYGRASETGSNFARRGFQQNMVGTRTPSPRATLPLKLEPLSARRNNPADTKSEPALRPIKLNRIPPIGLPISSAGGLLSCMKSIERYLMEYPHLAAISVMLHTPKRRIVPLRGEKRRKHQTPEAVFRRRLGDLRPGINVVAHASFTSSLGSNDPRQRALSARNLERELKQCRSLGINVLIFHLGCSNDPDTDVGRTEAGKQLREILTAVPGVTLAIETMTNRCRGEMASSLIGIKRLIDLVDLPGRLKICLDLCHTLQEFDIVQSQGRTDLTTTLESVGYTNIAAIHISDSYNPHGSNIDRHANLLCGLIPIEAFQKILLVPQLRDVPIILETPSYFPDLDPSMSSLHAQAANLERQRRLAELDFLVTALRYPQARWDRSREAFIHEYTERIGDLERGLYGLVRRVGGETLEKLKKHRKGVRSDEAKARAYRRTAILRADVKEDDDQGEDKVEGENQEVNEFETKDEDKGEIGDM